MGIKKILVTFENGKTALYTTSILHLLLTDKEVISIVDFETGEVIK